MTQSCSAPPDLTQLKALIGALSRVMNGPAGETVELGDGAVMTVPGLIQNVLRLQGGAEPYATEAARLAAPTPPARAFAWVAATQAWWVWLGGWQPVPDRYDAQVSALAAEAAARAEGDANVRAELRGDLAALSGGVEAQLDSLAARLGVGDVAEPLASAAWAGEYFAAGAPGLPAGVEGPARRVVVGAGVGYLTVPVLGAARHERGAGYARASAGHVLTPAATVYCAATGGSIALRLAEGDALGATVRTHVVASAPSTGGALALEGGPVTLDGLGTRDAHTYLRWEGLPPGVSIWLTSAAVDYGAGFRTAAAIQEAVSLAAAEASRSAAAEAALDARIAQEASLRAADLALEAQARAALAARVAAAESGQAGHEARLDAAERALEGAGEALAGLGSAAHAQSADFATAAQGGRADSAVQPGALASKADKAALEAEAQRAANAEAALGESISGKADKTALAAKADAGALADEIARATLAEALLASGQRPGDLAASYASGLTGVAAVQTPYAAGAAVVDADLGSALQLTTAAHVAQVAPVPIEPGRVYRGRWAVKRLQNPSDPLSDAIEIGVRWLSANQAGVTGGSGNRVVETLALSAAQGALWCEATFSLDVAEADHAIPAAARYGRPWARTYGEDHATLIGRASLEDVTEAWAADRAAQEAAEAGEALAVEAAVWVAQAEAESAARDLSIRSDLAAGLTAEAAARGGLATEASAWVAQAEAESAARDTALRADLTSADVARRVGDGEAASRADDPALLRDVALVETLREARGEAFDRADDPALLRDVALVETLREARNDVSSRGADLAALRLAPPPEPAVPPTTSAVLLGLDYRISGRSLTVTAGRTAYAAGGRAVYAGGALAIPAPASGRATGEAVSLRYHATPAYVFAAGGRLAYANIRNLTVAGTGAAVRVQEDHGAVLLAAAGAEVEATASYDWSLARIDLIEADRLGALHRIAGTDRVRDAVEYMPSPTPGRVPLLLVRSTAWEVTAWPYPDLETVSVSAPALVQRARARRMPNFHKALRAGAGVVIAGYGDSRTSLGPSEPTPYAPNGPGRDRVVTAGYLVTQGADFRASLPLYDHGDGAGLVHSHIGWNWELLRAVEERFPGSHNYLNFGIGGTASGSTGDGGRVPARLAGLTGSGSHLAVIAFGMNELGAGATTENLAAIGEACRTAGIDPVFIPPARPNLGGTPLDSWLIECAEVKAAADWLGAPFVDLAPLYGSDAPGLFDPRDCCMSNLYNHDGVRELTEIGRRLTQIILDI